MKSSQLPVVGWAYTFSLLIAVIGLLDRSLAQNKTSSTKSTSQATQIPRPTLQSRVSAIDSVELYTLGNTSNARLGAKHGLEGVVYRYSSSKSEMDQSGYIRWYVVIRRFDGKPFPRDEQLQFHFLEFCSGFEPEVIHSIELRQGTLESESSFLAPSYPAFNTNRWRRIVCNVYSDGREIRGLKTIQGGLHNFNQQQNGGVEQARSIVIANPSSTIGIDSQSTDQLEILESRDGWVIPSLNVALLAHLPTDWRELAAYSNLAIDADELVTCSPEQSRALRQFVVAGGQLVIADCPPIPKIKQEIKAWLNAFMPSSVQERSHWTEQPESKKPESKKSFASSFASIGFGQIYLSQGKLNEFTRERGPNGFFYRRPRLDRLFEVDLMNWTIPKLGQPPVIVFCIAIGAFAVLAGPALMWWTNIKIRRPVWLLVFFPFFALIITTSIFAYALLHDGFGISARIRSMTWVDAATGFGCAYSRQTYFSGFPPSSVDFDNASEVWEVASPHDDRDNNYQNEPTSAVSLQMTSDQQRYRGFLTAREQKQWIVTTPVENLKPFEWTPSTEDELPRVRNLLKESWSLAVFVERDKSIYIAERVGANDNIELKEISLVEARILSGKSIPAPDFPLGYSQNGSQSLFDWMNYRAAYYRNSRNASSTPVPTLNR